MAAPRSDRDLAIKLFGCTITLPDSTAAGAATEVSTADDVRSDQPRETESEEVKAEADGSGQEKELKKPDEIVPCPRCNSMETKFCYFNNYSVNQPRHYCRTCKRYWTVGGLLKDLPVGAGRRKSKAPVLNTKEQNNGKASTFLLPAPPLMPAPGLSTAPAVSFPLVPTLPSWSSGMWSSHSPWPGSSSSTLPSPPPGPPLSITSSGNVSPKLGKHPREENSQGEEKKGNEIWVPKALRIIHPEEAAKSSYLVSLGITPVEEGTFKSSQSKVLKDDNAPDPPQAQ